MADKILRINFSGICMLSPGPPSENEKPPDYKPPKQAFVLMAKNLDESGKRGGQRNAWGKALPDHFAFVHVAASLVEKQLQPLEPRPDETVAVCDGGEHFIYYFEDARVEIDCPKRGTPIHYFIDPKRRPLADRPGSNDVAPPSDFRWVVGTHEIFSKPATLKIDPAAENVGDEVLAIVNLDGGTLRANFPADTVNAKTFADVNGHQVRGFSRALADEFVIDIPYPEDRKDVTFSFKPLRPSKPVTGHAQLVFKWPEGENVLNVRMGYDPKEEIRLLDTDDRFDPVRLVGPVLKPRDDDFDLHYNLLNVPDGHRPLPQNDIHQCRFDDCKPLAVSSTPGGGI